MTGHHYSEQWREQAACLGYPHNDNDPWFFDEETPGFKRARKVARTFCRVCPVRRECLTYALTWEADHPRARQYGIYGGLTPHERELLTRRTGT